MRRTSAIALALIAALTAAAPAAAAPNAETGVVIAENLERGPGGHIGEIEAAATAELGAGWGSMYVSWTAFQPNGPGALDTATRDFYRDRFATLKGQGRKVNVTFIDTPAWASGNSASKYYAPKDPQAFGAFVSLFAAEFASEVDGYELGNEPDGGHFWLPGPDPGAYAGYARAGAAAVKAADTVGENKVFIGATVGANDEFMEQVLGTHGLGRPENRGLWDAVAIHTGTACKTDPPQHFIREETGSADIHNNNTTAYREMAHMMRSLGIENPAIADTAAGWASMPEPNSCNTGAQKGAKPGGVTEGEQAKFLADYFGCAQGDPELKYVFIFSLYDMADASKWDQRMGLRRFDRSAKPAFNTLKSVFTSSAPPAFSGGGFCGGYVDHTPPTAQVMTSAPVVKGVPSFTGALPLTAKGTDQYPIKAVRLAVDGKNIPGTTKNGEMSLEWQGAKDLKLGEHTVTATVEDEAGNIAQAPPLKVKKVTPNQMPRTKTKLTAKLKRKRGRKVTITGRLSWGVAGLVRPTGRIRIHFKKGKFVSKYSVSSLPRSTKAVSKSFTKTATLRKKGKWQVIVFYEAKAPYANSRAKKFFVKVR